MSVSFTDDHGYSETLTISNTMALSVYERTRELGLLRAVGMDKWQIGGAIALAILIGC